MKILANPSLRDRTCLRIGGRAQAEVKIEAPGDWDLWAGFLEREGLRSLVLGRGSNLLVQDGELPLCIGRPIWGRPEVVGRKNGLYLVRVPAGFPLPGLLHWLQDQGLAGLEGLAGIPADVGGAVAMNAGSFGCCIADCLHRVRCWSPQTGLIWLEREQMLCSYRTFQPRGLGGEWVIHEVELACPQEGKERIKRRTKSFLHRKRQTQPVEARTCGCTFKNPSLAAAGQLLDACGMRGRHVGGVEFSSRHANFLVNSGQGLFVQAWELIAEARKRVLDRYGVELELEVQVVDPLHT